jgi:hypothetical protein
MLKPQISFKGKINEIGLEMDHAHLADQKTPIFLDSSVVGGHSPLGARGESTR